MKKYLWTAMTLVLVLLIPSALTAAEPITIGATETLHSKVLDEDRTLMVYLPAGYKNSEAIYPVLYLLDARARFHHTTGTLQSLARSGHIPEMIVVGIVNTNRTRDLTPSWTHNDPEDIPEGREGVIAQGGGADNFLRFIREELVPHVDKKYRTAPFKLLSGHSFGGLFAVHAFVTDPDLFSATLSISPSLWWDQGESIQKAKALFESRPDLDNHLYLTLANEGGDMADEFRNMETMLRYRAPANLAWRAQVLDGEDHGSIPGPSTISAMRFFFPRWRVPAFVQAEGLAAVDGHYAALSESYGYPIVTPEATVNNMGYAAIGAEEYDKAIAIFTANVERHPDSSNVYDSLGEAVEAAGRPEEALELYSKALKIGESRGNDPNIEAYKGHIEAVKEKLGQ